MITIPLSRGMVALIDDCDAHLTAFKWNAKRCGEKWYYAARTARKWRSILMHREILVASSGIEVDHINGNGLDNRRANLRLATTAQNQANSARRTDNKSGYRGVYWLIRDRRWKAHITGKRIHLGYFETAEDAARAYDLAARERWGEFAQLNFPITVEGKR